MLNRINQYLSRIDMFIILKKTHNVFRQLLFPFGMSITAQLAYRIKL